MMTGAGDPVFNIREYLMTIAAVFLALALGILIGVSLGDGFLAANQSDVMQMMELRLLQLREDLALQEAELQRWEALKPAIWRHFSGALSGVELFLLSPAGREYTFLESALQEAGAAVTVALVQDAQSGAGEEEGRRHAGSDEIAAFLAEPEIDTAALVERGLLFPGNRPERPPAPPDLFLLLVEPADFATGELFSELAAALHEQGNRVIVLQPWCDEMTAGSRAGLESAFGLVDNIDTFWGQIALLKMIAGNSGGHYGFGKNGSGLIPEENPED